MRLLRTLIFPLGLGALASCGDPVDPGCAGWRPVWVDDATVDYLAAHDPQALAALTAHQEYGQQRGCWR